MVRIFLLLLITAGLGSCAPVKDFPEVLPGSWKMDNTENPSIETWRKVNDTLLTGISTGADGQTEETIELRKEGKDWYYIPTVNGQNDNRPVPFRLVSNKHSRIVFENKQHDFPQQITYNFSSDDHLVVELSGNGKQYEIYFIKLDSPSELPSGN